MYEYFWENINVRYQGVNLDLSWANSKVSSVCTKSTFSPEKNLLKYALFLFLRWHKSFCIFLVVNGLKNNVFWGIFVMNVTTILRLSVGFENFKRTLKRK